MNDQGKPVTILLIEDSDDDAFFFRWTLEKTRLRCDFERVIDGPSAIRYLDSARQSGRIPEAIFLDLKMPGMSGFEVLEWARRERFDPPLNILVLSGSDQDGDVRQARALGVEHYLVKPISTEQFQELLGGLRPSAINNSPASGE
jgi:CheY-like chemotaxis protein